MKVLHFGDIHFWKLGTDRDFYYPKRALGSVNLTLRRRWKFPPAYAQAVAQEVARQDADLVLFSGDFTTMSLKAEYRMAAEAFAPIREKFGDRLFAIPGNHDRYTPLSVRSRRFEESLPFAASLIEGALTRSHVVSERLALIGFDCSHPCRIRSNGTMTDQLVAELREALEAQCEAGRQVFLVGHYPYAYPPEVEISWEHKLLEMERLTELVAEFKPAAYFHGHKHIRWQLRPPETPETPCLNCGAAGMKSSSEEKQAGFLTAEFGDEDFALTRLTAHVLSEDASSFSEKLMEIV
ncbi:MAG: 3',5'-cyclic AMP phosphodiesterase CpdA [Verrucomicrobiales bacterium]